MLDALYSALLQVACLLTPVVAMFLYGLARFTLEHFAERRRAHRRAQRILAACMWHEYEHHTL